MSDWPDGPFTTIPVPSTIKGNSLRFVLDTDGPRCAISIRARPWKGRIRYRIVDEYGTRLPPYFASSELPLTFGEMIEQIEGSEYPEYCRGLVLGALDAGLKEGSDPKTLATFYEVSSDFYDELPDYYARAIREWYGQFGDWEADIGEDEWED